VEQVQRQFEKAKSINIDQQYLDNVYSEDDEGETFMAENWYFVRNC